MLWKNQRPLLREWAPSNAAIHAWFGPNELWAKINPGLPIGLYAELSAIDLKLENWVFFQYSTFDSKMVEQSSV